MGKKTPFIEGGDNPTFTPLNSPAEGGTTACVGGTTTVASGTTAPPRGTIVQSGRAGERAGVGPSAVLPRW